MAITRVEKEKRTKLQKQAKKVVFTGYDKDYSYRFWDPESKTTFRSRNSIFFESEFHFLGTQLN